MKKVALIEDDADLFNLLKYNLEKEGFAVVGQMTGKNALEMLRREKPDLVILDILLPDMDGLEICRAIKTHPELAPTPVIFLTAKASETDRIVGLELGADDYVVKPFFVRELVARVKNRLRERVEPPQVLRAGPIELDRRSLQVRVSGQRVFLTPIEFKLLEFLMSHPGVVFTRDQLLDAVWGHGRAVTTRSVDVYILRLRRKIQQAAGSAPLIQSVRGFGYTFSTTSS